MTLTLPMKHCFGLRLAEWKRSSLRETGMAADEWVRHIGVSSAVAW